MSFNGFGRLFNHGGEIIAEGNCDVDPERGVVNLHPLYDNPLIGRQHGLLRLELEDGSAFSISDRVIRFRLNVPGARPGPAYRLFFAGELRSTPASGEPS